MSQIRLTSSLFLSIAMFAPASAATVEVISEASRPSIQGKEVDWIDGDFVLANDLIIAVIAHPTPTRDANMTVRGVGTGDHRPDAIGYSIGSVKRLLSGWRPLQFYRRVLDRKRSLSRRKRLLALPVDNRNGW